MYSVRLWASAHSRFLERIYNVCKPIILPTLRGASKVFGRTLDKPITAIEAGAKSFFFDCKMCGDCVLSKTGMVCPMNCPKSIRNGPCGGVRDDGMCEVNPNMRCVWVEAWAGASRMKEGDAIKDIQFAVDYRFIGTSSWLKLARDD